MTDALSLTGAQRSLLRSAARRLDVSVVLGKGGLSEQAVAHAAGVLGSHELIKVRLLESAADDRRAAAEALAEALGAAVVDVIGRVVVLYRPNPLLPEKERIHLPKSTD